MVECCYAASDTVTGTNHGLTGAVLALVIKEPLIAIPASYLSHYACDAIPHFGLRNDELFKKQFNIILVVDFAVAVTFMIALGSIFPDQRWLIWACMIAAESPDLASAYYRLYLEHIKHRKIDWKKVNWLYRFHRWIQKSQTRPGAFVEVIWFTLMLNIILAKA